MKPDLDTFITQTALLPTWSKEGERSASVLASLYQRLALYYCRYRTRRQLYRLSPEQLRDIGITAEQAEKEAKKFFWE